MKLKLQKRSYLSMEGQREKTFIVLADAKTGTESIAEVLPFPSDNKVMAQEIVRRFNAHEALQAVVERVLYEINGLNATERATRSGYSGSELHHALTDTVKQAAAVIAALKGLDQ